MTDQTNAERNEAFEAARNEFLEQGHTAEEASELAAEVLSAQRKYEKREGEAYHYEAEADPVGEEARRHMDMVSSAITALMHEIPPYLALIVLRERTQWIARVLMMDGDSFADWMRYERDVVAITCPGCFTCFRFDVLLGESEEQTPTCPHCGGTEGLDPEEHRIPEVVELSCPAGHTHTIGTGLCLGCSCLTEGCEENIHVPRHYASRCLNCGGELYDLGEVIDGEFAGQDRVIALGLVEGDNGEERELVRIFWREEDGGDTTDEYVEPAHWRGTRAHPSPRGFLTCSSGCNIDENDSPRSSD